MTELWDVIQSIHSFEELWEWAQAQSTSMKIFLSAIAFGVIYVSIVLILFLVPFEKN